MKTKDELWEEICKISDEICDLQIQISGEHCKLLGLKRKHGDLWLQYSAIEKNEGDEESTAAPETSP